MFQGKRIMSIRRAFGSLRMDHKMLIVPLMAVGTFIILFFMFRTFVQRYDMIIVHVNTLALCRGMVQSIENFRMQYPQRTKMTSIRRTSCLMVSMICSPKAWIIPFLLRRTLKPSRGNPVNTTLSPVLFRQR